MLRFRQRHLTTIFFCFQFYSFQSRERAQWCRILPRKSQRLNNQKKKNFIVWTQRVHVLQGTHITLKKSQQKNKLRVDVDIFVAGTYLVHWYDVGSLIVAHWMKRYSDFCVLSFHVASFRFCCNGNRMKKQKALYFFFIQEQQKSKK